MQDKITVIIIARNREAWRIEDQVKSIRDGGEEPSFLLVDYGSKKEFSTEYEQVCTELEIEYFRVFSDGLPWSRTHALNCGVKKAKTPYIVASDIDIVYDKKPFTWCLANCKEKDFVQFNLYWVPKNGDKNKAKSAGHDGSQGMQFIPKSFYEDIGGYDESIKYWGSEDMDWSLRLQKVGYNQVWMPDEYKIFHQWHPKENTFNWKRPVSATQNTLKRLYKNTFEPKLSQDWGVPFTKENRPILEQKEINTPKIITLPPDELSYFGTIKTLLQSKEEKFVKLELGKRIKTLSVAVIKNFVKALLKPSSTYQTRLNTNFDFLYELLPILTENGLEDYFIEDDFSAVYLLWKQVE